MTANRWLHTDDCIQMIAYRRNTSKSKTCKCIPVVLGGFLRYLFKFIGTSLGGTQNIKIKFLVYQVTLILYSVLVGFIHVWGYLTKKTFWTYRSSGNVVQILKKHI